MPPQDDDPAIARVARFLGDGVANAHSIERAADLLALIQEPDDAMLGAGDGEVWRRMIGAALAARWSIPDALTFGEDPPLSGADEEGDMTVAGSKNLNAASWVQLRDVEQ